MPVECTYCGQMLTQDDARFCQHCGMLVPSHPFSPQSLAAPKKSSAAEAAELEHKKTELPEQVAQQPSSRTANGPESDELSARVRHSNRNDTVDAMMYAPEEEQPRSLWEVGPKGRSSDASLRPSSAEKTAKGASWPTPAMHITVYDHLESPRNEAASPPTKPPKTEPSQHSWDLPEESPLSHQAWDVEEDEKSSTEVFDIGLMQPLGNEDIDALPTLHMPAEVGKSSGDIDAQPTQNLPLMADERVDVANIDTTHMPTFQNVPALPDLPPLDMPTGEPALSSEAQKRISASGFPSWPGNEPANPSFSGVPPVQQPSAPSFSNVSVLPVRRRSRTPTVLISLLLLLLVVGGAVSAWVVIVKPFSVPVVTQPQTNFSDSSLGFSLLYPTGWSTQIDRSKSAAHFHDSSNTTMVDVASNDSAGQDVDQYLQQVVTQLGMTGAKVGDQLSFAGSAWKQTQGTVTLNGASYTCTIFAIARGSRVVTYTQYAPQSTYADTEQIIFKSMRDSLHFL